MGEVHVMKSTNLDNVELLKPMTRADRAELAGRCTFVTFAKGDMVFRQGENGPKSVAFVVSGGLSARGSSQSGKDVIFERIGPGGHTGESSAIDGRPRTANLVADKTSIVALMPDHVFLELIATNPSVAMLAMARLVAFSRECSSRLLDATTKPAAERVYGEILQIVTLNGVPSPEGGIVVRSMPDHLEIARRTGLTRETVCRAFSKASRLGLLQRRDRAYVVRDLDALSQLADRLAS